MQLAETCLSDLLWHHGRRRVEGMNLRI